MIAFASTLTGKLRPIGVSRVFPKGLLVYRYFHVTSINYSTQSPTGIDITRKTRRSVSIKASSSESNTPYAVSPHTPLQRDILQSLQRLNTKTRVNSSNYLEVKECYLCNKGKKSNADNCWKLNVRADGSYYCFRCSVGGNYQDFKKKINTYIENNVVNKATLHETSVSVHGDAQFDDCTDYLSDEKSINWVGSLSVPSAFSASSVSSKQSSSSDKHVLPMQRLAHQYGLNLFPPTGSPPDRSQLIQQRQKVKSYLNDNRGLCDEVLRKYQIGFTVQQFLNEEEEWKDQLCVTFPWIYFADQVNASNFTSPSILQPSSAVINDKLVSKKGKSASTSNGGFLEDPIKLDFRSSTEFDKNGDNTSSSFYIVRTKYRALETKGLQRILPKGGAWGFFGWHTVREAAESATRNGFTNKSIVITEGEYDAMAVAQGLLALDDEDPMRYLPAVSLPNGCNSLPNELVGMLDQFETIYLWMDYDKSGQEACEKFTRKLGLSRCFIVKPLPDQLNPPKDANDALRQGDLTIIPSMLRASKTLSHQRIEQFSNLRQALKQKLSTGQSIEGSGTPSIPGLTQICKGFRRGELIILSGPTGSGKTTLLSQISLDFALAGKPVLWGSFEVKNQQLNLKLIHQFAKLSIPLAGIAEESVSKIMDDFEALPIQFMNYHGATNIDDLFETMEYAVDKDDIQHIFIDNLQFLLPRKLSLKSPFERLDLQDQVVDRFRNFATAKNVNVIMVVHPKKEDDIMDLGLGSIGGSAKCSQEADMVMILQKPNLGGAVALDIKKNRYDGFLGRIMLQYNATNQTLTQASDIISFQTDNNKYNSTLGMKVTLPAKHLWEQAMKRREEERSKTISNAMTSAKSAVENMLSPSEISSIDPTPEDSALGEVSKPVKSKSPRVGSKASKKQM